MTAANAPRRDEKHPLPWHLVLLDETLELYGICPAVGQDGDYVVVDLCEEEAQRIVDTVNALNAKLAASEARATASYERFAKLEGERASCCYQNEKKAKRYGKALIQIRDRQFSDPTVSDWNHGFATATKGTAAMAERALAEPAAPSEPRGAEPPGSEGVF